MAASSEASVSRSRLTAAILFAAFGYLVDVYDIVLVTIVRVPSLQALGTPDALLLPRGVLLLNVQMTGMVLGGLLWGPLADRRGRLSVLFASIALYSSATLANAWVASFPAYLACRLAAGIGLAGELGAGIALVSETMGRETRGWGNTIVVSLGVLGGAAAGWVGGRLSWRAAYVIGGVLGLALLGLRLSVVESRLYEGLREAPAGRGRLSMLLSPPERALRYLRVVLAACPLWYALGVLVTFAPEFGRAFGLPFPLSAARGNLLVYLGSACGNLAAGALSQALRSRKKVLASFLLLTGASAALFLARPWPSPASYDGLFFALGLGIGFWAVYMTAAAESFGTNLRGTVSTTVPNFVRGTAVPITASFRALVPSLGLAGGAAAAGAAVLALSLAALAGLPETFGRDLDFLET